MTLANLPFHVIDTAIESSVADLGTNPLTLSAVNADLKYHRKNIVSLRNDLRDLARKFQRACVGVSELEGEHLANEYESARAVLQERLDDHKVSVARLEKARSKFLFCFEEVNA
ncbi:hypothetical protein [Pseudidiomarina homiensis]|uniref:Uncharacterized protein n=1 Tax=Pseudidiomarina homiensis TaxID=364198 RepID=A0A432XSE5_9GAMM|nr:hypothetical protein [Pseudidiomarina homiensis]RUO51655.1 hypothetical protein CWI70_12385 [Pseudidiomarina homiensis]